MHMYVVILNPGIYRIQVLSTRNQRIVAATCFIVYNIITTPRLARALGSSTCGLVNHVHMCRHG